MDDGRDQRTTPGHVAQQGDLFEARMLAEAIRALERDGAEAIHDESAELAARAITGDLESRIIERAARLPVAAQLRAALRQINTVTGWVIVGAGILALFAGAGTAFAALGRGVGGEGVVVNFYVAIGAVLGVQTLMLAAWFVLVVASSMRQRPTEGLLSLGRAAVAAAQWLTSRIQRGRITRAAVHAWSYIHATGLIGRWTFSSITHGLWLSFNIGCLGAIMLLLSTRHYQFVWETTILEDRHYVRLTHGLSYLPSFVGFDSPDDEQIARSRWTGRTGTLDDESRRAWSSLLVGSIVLYGFAPRILLFGWSLSRRRTAANRFALDTRLPGYARLESRLFDTPTRCETSDDVGGPSNPAAFAISAGHPSGTPRIRPAGPPAMVGIEIARPAVWPPRTPHVVWDDLGVVESRDDRRSVLAAIGESATEPAVVLMVCDLATTPDRGIGRFIAEIVARLARPAAVILTGGQSLRSRGMDTAGVASRVADWIRLCIEAGVAQDRIIELDLDHITAAGLQRIASLAGENSRTPEQVRHIEEAFELIRTHAKRWFDQGAAPTTDAQAELHRAIATLYQSSSESWRESLGFRHVQNLIEGNNIGRLTEQMRSGATRMTELLPMRLRKSPKWLAAGALSGALGCVAASLLISPVAIAALPAWAGIAAAVAAIWQPIGHEKKAPNTAGDNVAAAVRAAVLFAMVLELQGHAEADITRILDATIPDHEQAIRDATEVKNWLDSLRHRFNIAVAETLQ
ncbi:MAG TPA: DUF2868 domain-containing protein [Phycisphaerales bacterium]|nr:DUF2868 domain-containing protein [Phycisphaerales bacterium]HRQ76546.1 DUF2868 domain-containing protein [Phycisphaerales bacterium]